MQEAFLFKSELDTNDDGKLLLEFFLSGNINVEELNHAWGKTIQRHEVLRTYISKGEGRSYIQKTF